MTNTANAATKTTITIGQVSTRKHARLHATTDGQAICHSGLGKILGGTEVDLTAANARRVCRTRACRTAIRTQIVAAHDANDRRASSTYRRTRQNELIVLAEKFETPAETARRATFAADHAAWSADEIEQDAKTRAYLIWHAKEYGTQVPAGIVEPDLFSFIAA